MSTFKNVNANFLAASDRREALLAYAYIETIMGLYVYGETSPALAQLPEDADVPILDGSIILDGSTILGSSAAVVDKGPYLVGYPNEITESISPDGSDLISGLQHSELTEFTVSLANTDHHISEVTEKDVFLNAECWLLIGFATLVYTDFLEILRGRIQGYSLSHDTADLRVLK